MKGKNFAISENLNLRICSVWRKKFKI